jgi:hypothetical protein
MVERREGVKTIERWERIEGVSSPLGVTWVEEHQAYNFALYSRHASAVTLLLYTEQDPATPVYQYQFHYLANKTGPVWHCWLPAMVVNEAHKKFCLIPMLSQFSSRLTTAAMPAPSLALPMAGLHWECFLCRRRPSTGGKIVIPVILMIP